MKKDTYAYCANAVATTVTAKNIKTAVFSSCSIKAEKLNEISKNIVAKLGEIGFNAVLIDGTGKSFDKISDEINACVGYDCVFVSTVSALDDFAALQTAKLAKNVFVIEQYTKTSHHRFDELIAIFKQNEIEICGAITA